MTTHYPRRDGRPLAGWIDLPADIREHLASQVPARLQRIMYNTEVGEVPADQFAAAIAEADRKLAELLAADPDARQYFGDWTFAAVADTSDPMGAAEAEYYLCDALIEYGERHYGDRAGVWSLPILDPSLYGLFKESR
ncbi:hypothetical protein [Streptomyces sp. NPDC126499]|uniref:hypothetical protein n=1 Tax=Streptomyces sp. NPDC126499 TaxID=3155314 RepID=UPI003322770E